jgi:hypothetical protein
MDHVSVNQAMLAFADQDATKTAMVLQRLYDQYVGDSGRIPIGPLVVQVKTAFRELFERHWASKVRVLHPATNEPLFVLHVCPHPVVSRAFPQFAARILWLRGEAPGQWLQETVWGWQLFQVTAEIPITARPRTDGFFYTRSKEVSLYREQLMALASSAYRQTFWLPWDGRRLTLTIDSAQSPFSVGVWREVFEPATAPVPGDVTMWRSLDLNSLYQDLGLFEVLKIDKARGVIESIAAAAYKAGAPPHKPRPYDDTAGLF